MLSNLYQGFEKEPIPPIEGATICGHHETEGDVWYKELDCDEVMKYEELEKLYKGYSVFLIKCEVTETTKLLSGIPKIISNTQSAGAEDGIYKKYLNEECMQLRHETF